MVKLSLRWTITCASCFALLSSYVHAADLLTIYRDALANDAVYAGAKATAAAGAEKVPQGIAGLLPVVGLTASTVANHANVTYRDPVIFSSGSRFFNTSGYVLTLTQPLFRWQNWEAYQQSNLFAVQSEAAFAQSAEDLIVRTAQAYFDVLAAQDIVDVTGAQKAAIAQQLAQARRSFELGKATIVDTHEAKSRYDLAVAAEITARNDLESKKTALQQIIRNRPEELARIRADAQLPTPVPDAVDLWVAASQADNYAVKALGAAAEAAKRNVDINRAGHYPTLDLVASRTVADATGATTFNVGNDLTRNAVGLQLAIPIFAGGSVNSRVREALANYDKALADLDNQRRTAAQNVRQAFLGVTGGLAQVDAYKEAVASSEVSVSSNKKGAQVGVRINIDVLNAEQQLYQARQNLAKARYDVIVNGFKLKAAAGSLTENDIAAVNQLLEH